MKAIRSFTVRPSLPPELAALEELAMNLRWSWDAPTRDLFRWVDPDAWDATVHDPTRLLGLVSPERLQGLVDDPGFMRVVGDVREELQRYLGSDRWFQARKDSPLRSVAYFSPEFGIAEAVPQYSGGLGVLAGDHLKAASDLGLPLVGIGLFYRHGYFRQSLSVDGWQQERYPDLDPYAMALEPCGDLRIEVDLAGVPLVARIWKAAVGRIPLYLIDADVDENPPDTRIITDRLYGGDTEHRLRQEILLGIGGVRALEALDIDAQVFHTNEGHAGFLGLERIRQLVKDPGLSYAEAIEAVRAGCLFTTHTPVPAGIDRFPRELIERYFAAWADEVGITLDELMTLGHRPGDEPDERFNMAVMGLRLAGRSNAVAKLHGEVSREMFRDLWPDVPPEEVPITSVTNGVHAQTWTAPEMADLLTRHVLPEWHEAGPERWARLEEATDDEVWRTLGQTREATVAFVRQRLAAQIVNRGLSPSDAAWTDSVLDPRLLTVGFARRFATYKRATLLLSQPNRLRALLLNDRHPVQFVFAGKSHPADDSGKELIREIAAFAADPELRHRFVFVEDYDIAVARTLLQGVDVWLNNPVRPHEACGTSGMKAAFNGGLNLSILDGWWDECFDSDNGWAISSAEWIEDVERRDELEANSLFELLERQVVPLFYDRGNDDIPHGWVRRVKRSLMTLGPFVSAARMVRDYTEQLYEPTARQTDALAADGHKESRAIAEWKARVHAAWDGVHVDHLELDTDVAELGGERRADAVVALGALTPIDVQVQLLHGPAGQGDELTAPTIETMTQAGEGEDGHLHYTGRFTCDSTGRYGATVRIVPSHPHLVHAVELGRVAWAG
jgi:starch phosphorylase